MGTREHLKTGQKQLAELFESQAEKFLKPEPTEEPKPAKQSVQEQRPKEICDGCGDGEFWLDIYGGGPYCTACNPAKSRGMIGREYLVSGTGRKWGIERIGKMTIFKPIE